MQNLSVLLPKKELSWKTLGFDYIQTDFRFEAFHDGNAWSQGELTTENTITVHEGSTALHYGQQCFEGLKAYQAENGDILLFRPEENARRMITTANRLMMAPVPEQLFMDAVTQTVKANYAWIPPYGTNASLYIRPLLIGVGKNIGIKRAPNYIFRVFVTPVGPYYKSGGLPALTMSVFDYDRAAPLGIGAYKAGANYAGGIASAQKVREAGADEIIYLDSKYRKYLDEAGTANIVVKMKNGDFCTPKSPSILPSVTRRSIMVLAKEKLGLHTVEREIAFPDESDAIEEMGACGTAAIISPIGKILMQDKTYRFYNNGDSAGPCMTRLYQELTGIQFGEKPDPYDWVHRIRM